MGLGDQLGLALRHRLESPIEEGPVFFGDRASSLSPRKLGRCAGRWGANGRRSGRGVPGGLRFTVLEVQVVVHFILRRGDKGNDLGGQLGQIRHLEGNAQVGVGCSVSLGVLGQAFVGDVRAEHQHREGRAEAPFLDLPAEDESRLIGKLGTKHHQVGPPLFQFSKRVGGAARRRGLVPRALEHRCHAQGKVALAIYNENAAFHGISTKNHPTQRTADLKSDAAFTYTGVGSGERFQLGMG